jgi:PAS domain S-box-containing protein
MKAPFLQEVLDGMAESVKIIDNRYRLVYANSTSRKNLGMELNELRGRSCHETFYGFKEKCFFCGMGRVFERGESLTNYCTLSVNGSNRDFEVSVFPLCGTSRTVDYAVEIVRDITSLSKGATLPKNAGKISSRDRAFGMVFENMAHWAEDGWPVLLQGEKGTGKKSFAQALHHRSPKAGGPFRVFLCEDCSKGQDCEGLFGPGGAWELARGGTLYLDGICHLKEADQKELAERLFKPAEGDNPRVVAATSLDVLSLVHKEILRSDFYNRFAPRVLRLPALRDRKQDLPFLAQHFIETYKVLTGSPAEKMGPQAVTQLMTYAWPGNIRELETQIERACLLATGPQIEKLDVPIEAPKTEKLDDLLDLTEKTYLVDTLTKTRGGLNETAKLSGLSLKTLQRKMKKYHLKAEDFRNLPDN